MSHRVKYDPKYLSSKEVSILRGRHHKEIKKIKPPVNTFQAKARDLVLQALKKGELVRPTQCSKCLEGTRIHGHHEDYSKPLEIIWLCHRCHKARHVELDRIKGYRGPIDTSFKTYMHHLGYVRDTEATYDKWLRCENLESIINLDGSK